MELAERLEPPVFLPYKIAGSKKTGKVKLSSEPLLLVH